MNKLSGKIIRIESSEHMSLVDIDVSGDVFCSVVLETPRTAAYLKVGRAITILFKENEVSIAKNLSGPISLRNRFYGVIQHIECSKILAKIILNYKNTRIISIITSRSVDKLALKKGDEIEWLVKTNEVSLLSGEE
ncbi:MAG: TOBE domain-containing protein [Candidatus Omnitrophota bacterium]